MPRTVQVAGPGFKGVQDGRMHGNAQGEMRCEEDVQRTRETKKRKEYEMKILD